MKKDTALRMLKMELIVGAFLTLAFLGLGYFTILLSRDAWLRSDYRMAVAFPEVMGLRDGDNVIVRGMSVGTVKQVSLAPNAIQVLVNLKQPLEMREGYKVTIVATSILGGRHMRIDPGPSTNAPLPSTTVFEGTSPRDLMGDVAEVAGALKKALIADGTISNLTSTSQQLRDISVRLNTGKGSLGKLLSEDDTVYKDLSAAVASLRKISERIEKGEGALGKLVNDDSLYTDVKGAIRELRNTIDDYRETAPVVTFTSVFFGAF
jgi:phospholipid/cholesterol/gamma-HCH transport system substrate-binding protein